MHKCKSLTGGSDAGKHCTVSKCNTAIYAYAIFAQLYPDLDYIHASNISLVKAIP
jgi:hypothetical protein